MLRKFCKIVWFQQRSETPSNEGPAISGDASAGDAAPKLSPVKEPAEKAKKAAKAESKSPAKVPKPEPVEMVRAEDSVSSGSTPVDSSPVQQSKAAKDKKKAKKQDLSSALLNRKFFFKSLEKLFFLQRQLAANHS